MCGICGYYSFKNTISSKNILEMNKAIQHRGPDDEGFWLYENGAQKSFSGEDSIQDIKNTYPQLLPTEASNIAIGFRRLSILDLTANGHQPMVSDDAKVSITFNGEIYNFKSLREELIQIGYQFKSKTDTEVLLKGYQEWDTAIFEKLDGMFGLCIIDLIQKKIILARDRMGLKPLFYHRSETGLVWASEIKSILKADWITPEINWQGVYTNFLFQTTLSPDTCFKNIYSLEPASFMTIDCETFEIETRSYWQFPTDINNNITQEQAVEHIDHLLTESIKNQLFADVTVASMMSGGIDSTLITAKAKPLQDSINAFTIQYQLAEEEIKNASIMAKQIGVPHYIDQVSDSDIIAHLKENIQHFEEPYSSLEVLMNAAEFAKNKDFKVVLSGNGADELFGGYGHTLKLNKWLKLKPLNFVRHFIVTKDAFSDRVKNYFSQDTMFDFFRQSQVGMRVTQVKSLMQPKLFNQIKTDLSHFHRSESLDYQGYFEYDMRYSLSSHHVFRDDLSAMKYGVEFRYPYLSNDLVNFVATLPQHFRFNGSQNKPLLRQVAKGYLHQDVLNMPKRGFTFPLAHFIKTEKSVQDFVLENLDRLKQRDFFDPLVIDNWWHNAKEPYDYVKIWQLVTFEIWYQHYFDAA